MPERDQSQASPDPSSGIVAGVIEAGERLAAALRSGVAAIVSRRGMGLAVAGGFLVALAWVGERDSAWGFPMLICGALMIGLGLLGPRLSGSMALRWGDDGAFLQLTSSVAPPGKRHRAPALSGPLPDQSPPALPDKLVPPSEVEGVAETIDFKVTETGATADEAAGAGSAS